MQVVGQFSISRGGDRSATGLSHLSKVTEQRKEQDTGNVAHALYSYPDICSDPEVQVPQLLFYQRGN